MTDLKYFIDEKGFLPKCPFLPVAELGNIRHVIKVGSYTCAACEYFIGKKGGIVTCNHPKSLQTQ